MEALGLTPVLPCAAALVGLEFVRRRVPHWRRVRDRRTTYLSSSRVIS